MRIHIYIYICKCIHTYLHPHTCQATCVTDALDDHCVDGRTITNLRYRECCLLTCAVAVLA